MDKDYIIEETRKAGKKLAEKSNYDVHTFFENLRKNQNNNQARKEKQKELVQV